MKINVKVTAVLLALCAALFYAVNVPFSKLLMNYISSTMMASFLYLGAGCGVGILYLFHFKKEKKEERLTKNDLPYTIGMVVLDIAAPVFMMIGINNGNASSASLLSNFEIVATTLIALVLFKEKISWKLWISIGFIVLSSVLLSFDGNGIYTFSKGSLFVILATCCWGMENNCTRKISSKSTYEIVTVKGIFSGGASFIIALILQENIPDFRYIIPAMALGFISYGLSIFMYVRAQRYLGAAKTSAYYAVAPFAGSFLSFIIIGEKLYLFYFIGLCLMIIGAFFAVYDTLKKEHSHIHTHIITHTHDGSTHTHIVSHDHEHPHFVNEENHQHNHHDYLNSEEHRKSHEMNENIIGGK